MSKKHVSRLVIPAGCMVPAVAGTVDARMWRIVSNERRMRACVDSNGATDRCGLAPGRSTASLADGRAAGAASMPP